MSFNHNPLLLDPTASAAAARGNSNSINSTVERTAPVAALFQPNLMIKYFYTATTQLWVSFLRP